MLTIGKIAKAAGVGVETVRFYERKGLLAQPQKRPGEGFRHYRDDDASRIRFIKRAQELGFTLNEIADILSLNDKPSVCVDLRARAETKLAEVEAKIRDLHELRDSLRILSENCGRKKTAAALPKVSDCFEGMC